MASGQLAATLGTIETAMSSQHPVAVLLYNTNSVNETVNLSILPSGGTAKTLIQLALATGESLILSGISLGPADVLQGSATHASQVNYLTTPAPANSPISMQVFDSSGLLKNKYISGIGNAVNNFSATTDPVAGSDNTQGYAPGSVWINTTNSRVWMNLSAGTGAAVWLLSGVVPGTGVEPSTTLTQFGASAFGTALANFLEEGNLFRAVGNPFAANAADTTDDIIGGIVIPANAFDAAGRGVCITAQGKFAANGNNKRIKIWGNPTMSGQTVTNGVISGGTAVVGAGVLLFDSAVQTGNGVAWSMAGNWFKYGAANSNTQYFQGTPIFGTTHGGIAVPVFSTLTENAAINLVVTGSSPTTGAANDVLLNFLEINAMN